MIELLLKIIITKLGAGYIICQCCGCEVDREAKYDSEMKINYFEEEKRRGYGRFFLMRKDGNFSSKRLMSPLTDEQFENFKSEYYEITVDQEQSYLVSYRNGEFKILLGNVPDYFDLSYAEYDEKYGYNYV